MPELKPPITEPEYPDIQYTADDVPPEDNPTWEEMSAAEQFDKVQKELSAQSKSGTDSDIVSAVINQHNISRRGKVYYSGEKPIFIEDIRQWAYMTLKSRGISADSKSVLQIAREITFRAPISEEPEPELKDLSSFKRVARSFLYYPYIGIGNITQLSGDPGAGKSSFICGLIAKVTTGQKLIDCDYEGGNRRNCIIFSTEDDEQTWMQRVEDAGGDTSKVKIVGASSKGASSINLISPCVERYVQQHDPVLIVFDPIQNYLGCDVNGRLIDLNNMAAISAILQPFAQMLKRHNTAALIAMHQTKSSDQKSMMLRASGSAGIPGAARSMLTLVKDPNNPNDNILIHTKHNQTSAGKSIRYSVVAVENSPRDCKCHFKEMFDYTERDYEKARRTAERSIEIEEAAITYDNSPLTPIFKQLFADNPSGCFVWWQALQSIQQDSGEYVIDTPSDMLKHIRIISQKSATDGFRLSEYTGDRKHRCKAFNYNGQSIVPETNASRAGVKVMPYKPKGNPFTENDQSEQ